MTEEKNKKALFDAIKKNDLNSVKNLIEKDAELYVNIQDYNGNTPLHLAIKSGSISIVDYLLNFENIELSLKNDKEETPSNLVYFDDENQSKDEIVENIKRNSRFIKAIKDCDLKSFEDIVNDKDFKFKDKKGKDEILIFIMDKIQEEYDYEKTNLIKMIQILYKNEKINISEKGKSGDTLLHLAIKNNINDLAKFIIENKKIDINVQNNDKDTPLHSAIENGNTEMVDYLLSFKDIKLDLENNEGKTPSNLVYFDDENQNKDEIIKNIKRNSRFIKAIENRDVESFKSVVNNENFKFKDGEGEDEILFFITNIIKNKGTSGNTDFIQMIQTLFENKNIELNLTQKMTIYSLTTKKYINATPLCRLICKTSLVPYSQDLLEYLIKNYPESENNADEDLIITDNISNNNNLFHNICEMYKNKITSISTANISTTRILKTLFNKVKNKEEYINAKNADDNTPLDLALSAGNNEAINFLIRQEEINFEIIEEQNRKVLLYYFIVNGMTDLFKKYFNKEYLKDSFNINNITEKFLNCAQITMNKDIVKTIVDYTMKNIDSINHKNGNNDKASDIKKLLKVLITAENPYLDVINNVLNKIDKECLEQIKNENSEYFQIEEYNDGKETKYFIRKIKNVRKCFAKYSGGKVDDFQGLNQVVVDRTFDYDDEGKILSTVDIAFKIDTNDVVYKKAKTTEIEEENITYYKKNTKVDNEENELIEAVIDENRYIKFNNCKVQNSEEEVNNILNSYENPIGFDNTLSYLEYSQIKPNKKNKDFSINVSYTGDFNSIVDTFYESLENNNKEKLYFYNFSLDGHNVQLIIYNGKIVLFNTGFEFDYQCTNIQGRIEIDNRYNELPEYIKNNLNVTEFKVAEQTVGNCNLSSKISAVNFANNSMDKDFSKLLENVKQLQKEYGSDGIISIKGADENMLDLSSDMLKLSCQIYNENKNNYLLMSKNFAKLVKNIEKSILEKYKKIKDNKEKLEEVIKYESLIKKISLLEIKIIKEAKDELKYLNDVYNLLNKENEDLEKLKNEKMYIEEVISDLNENKKTEETAIKNLKDKGVELEEEKTEDSFKDRLEKLKLEKEKMISERSEDIKKNKGLTDGLCIRQDDLKAIINLFSEKNIEQFF